MGFWQRFTLVFKSKANKMLDKAEDPRETLDYSYESSWNCCRRCAGASPTWPPAASGSNCRCRDYSNRPTNSRGRPRRRSPGTRGPGAQALTRQSGLTVQLNDLQAQLTQLQDQEEDGRRVAASAERRSLILRRRETIKAQYSRGRGFDQDQRAFSGGVGGTVRRQVGDQRAEDPDEYRPRPAPSTNCSLMAPWTIRPGRPRTI